jgi:hypothetical protein
MLKKIVLGTLFTGLLSALVAGAVIRTADRIDRTGDGDGLGRGRNAQAEVGEQGRQAGRSGGGVGSGQGSGQGANGGGGQGENGGGQGNGQGGNAQGGNIQGSAGDGSRQGNGGNGQGGNGQGGNGQASGGQGDGVGLENVEDWLTLEGAVTAVDESALVLQVADGELIVDGRVWLYALEQGFSTEEGHAVAVTGFWEDGEFKPVELVDTTAGGSVTVRDEGGRPYWAGQGRGAGS